MKDAPIKSRKEASALGTVRHRFIRNAAMRVATTRSPREESALAMEQKSLARDAVTKDVQTL